MCLAAWKAVGRQASNPMVRWPEEIGAESVDEDGKRPSLEIAREGKGLYLPSSGQKRTVDEWKLK